MELQCPTGCHGKTVRPRPAKFSFDDRYGRFRLEEKKKMLKERGLY
jgi:rRNA maturation protein Nop10